MNVADMHCDTISEIYSAKCNKKECQLAKNDLHIDIEKMSKSDYLVQNFAVFTDIRKHENPLEYSLKLIDLFYQEMDLNKDKIAPALCYEDIIRNHQNGKMSALLTIEEGAVTNCRLEHLRNFYRLGVRMLTLTWNYPNGIGYPNFQLMEGQVPDFKSPDMINGLTEFGIEFIKEMERLGMIIDVSHLSDAGFYTVLNNTSKAFQKINKRLRAIQEEDTEVAVSFAKANEQSIVEVSTAAYSHTSLFMGFSFLSDRYLCIYQYVYEYTGGAHGMPYKKYYVFDLKTGDQLSLTDIVNNDQKEVHDIILEHFSEAIAEYPGKFDGNACDTVNLTAGLESAFYLTPDGIGFYYPPYDLACFAAGFQDVIIPYSEFDLRIDVSGAENISISSEQGLY
jgi:microsomal dipeptidase-like Zn-dependent dipeptidase